MSNETMPEKIWVNNNKFNDHSNGQGVWFNEKVKDDEVSYTRTDTIPSRAQVAREFMDKASSLYCNTDASSLWQAMLRLHAEWEEAECQ